MQLLLEDHPQLAVHAFVSRFAATLGEIAAASVGELLMAERWPELPAPDDSVRAAIRDALRSRGFKPTGRSKPSSEYLLRARSDDTLRPINLAVDAGNAVSLHSGLPISVVDLDRLTPPLQIRSAGAAERYVFNPAGQTIELSGLPCLHDAYGPAANAVKDAQRTKTGPETRATLNIVWSSQQLQARSEAALRVYRALLQSLGAQLEAVELGRLGA